MEDANAQTTGTRSFLQKLRQGEQHWAWKFSFRVAICILDIVGIGCAAWLANRSTQRNYFYTDYFYFDFFLLPGALTALSVSFVWCLIVILVFLLRRPPSPVHPGICVGIDLILWLGLIVTGLFAVGAVITVASYGADPSYLDDPSYPSGYDGHYVLKPNGTWVYKITYVSDPCDYGNYGPHACHYNATAGTYTSNRTVASVHRNCEPYFSSCAQQDAYINNLWQQKPLIEGTEIMVALAQWFGVLFHFILFVWACVDTNRYNAKTKKRYTQVNTQEIVDGVIRDMEARGLITVHNTAAGRSETTEMAEMAPAVAGPSRPRLLAAGRSATRGADMEIGQAR